MSWCQQCYEPCRTDQCEDCRRDERRERDTDTLDRELIEILDDCG